MKHTIKKEENFTEGSIVKTLLSLAVPIVFANILQTAYQLIDTFWVGRLGANAVAAVSISFPVIFLLISLGGGLAIAGTILVAQYKGRKDQEQVDHIAGQTLVLMVVVSIIVSVIGYFFSPVLLSFMGASPAITTSAVSYLQITFLGLVFLFGYAVFQSLMRGVGEVRVPVYIVLGTVFLNLILDPLFIFGYGIIPAFGVSGAAIATIGTQGIAALIGVGILLSGKYGITIRRDVFKLDFKLIKRMASLGLPASLEQSTQALGLIVLTFLVTSFSTTTIASYGIGVRILSFVIIPALGLSMATSTLVGQNIGAGQVERAKDISKIAALTAFVLLTIVGLIVFVFATPIVTLFIPGNTVVIAESALFVRIMSLSFGFLGIQQVFNGTFRGAGHTFVSMSLAIISLWVLRFPLAYILSKHTSLGVTGIWWAFPVSNVIIALVALWWFGRGSWKRSNILPEERLEEAIVEEVITEEGITA